MEAHNSSLQIAPNALDGGNRHICAFFNGMDEHYRVLQAVLEKQPSSRFNSLRRTGMMHDSR
jgi:hypothetical protein